MTVHITDHIIKRQVIIPEIISLFSKFLEYIFFKNLLKNLVAMFSSLVAKNDNITIVKKQYNPISSITKKVFFSIIYDNTNIVKNNIGIVKNINSATWILFLNFISPKYIYQSPF